MTPPVGSRAPLPAYTPTDEDLDTMIDVGTVDVFMKYTAVPDALASAFYVESGINPGDHYASAGQTSADEVEETLALVIASGVRVP